MVGLPGKSMRSLTETLTIGPPKKLRTPMDIWRQSTPNNPLDLSIEF